MNPKSLNSGTYAQETALDGLQGFGTVDTSVTSWALGTPIGLEANVFIANNSVEGGLNYRLARTGIYCVEAELHVGASQAMAIGISLDATAAELLNTTNPVQSATMKAVAEKTNPAGATGSLRISALLRITKAMVSGGTGLIRLHATNNAGGAAVLTPASRNTFRLLRVADYAA